MLDAKFSDKKKIAKWSTVVAKNQCLRQAAYMPRRVATLGRQWILVAYCLDV